MLTFRIYDEPSSCLRFHQCRLMPWDNRRPNLGPKFPPLTSTASNRRKPRSITVPCTRHHSGMRNLHLLRCVLDVLFSQYLQVDIGILPGSIQVTDVTQPIKSISVGRPLQHCRFGDLFVRKFPLVYMPGWYWKCCVCAERATWWSAIQRVTTGSEEITPGRSPR